MIFQKCKCNHVSLIKNSSLVSPYSDDKYQISLFDLTPVLFFSVFLHLSPHSLHPSSATLGFFQSLQCILLPTTEDLWIRCSLYLKLHRTLPTTQTYSFCSIFIYVSSNTSTFKISDCITFPCHMLFYSLQSFFAAVMFCKYLQVWIVF